MRTLGFILLSCLLVSGCSSIQEAYYVDREFGHASQASWDMQVAYPDYRHAANIPEGTEGITAEEIMDIYNKAYAEKVEKPEFFRFGIID